ncbi:LysR substrate-binding domain-containing protein [Massilia solisilvae]|uniref:LysR substrate-binding domain-containing protein n=1 Tax=Massilia solisilvae TaxID=1811225 RepID=A0ABT2BMZ7_9BURK|nr:LysR substrate-binding domain-containing protein [Massilia solisilvae]MCS0609894.1 LysR substrate-binding domain-containing protein [Massilia solisilvae]
MEITQIRHFVRIAETGSYIKAADLLDIGQSTLSRQVRALEVELRASLFYRHGRGVLLTEAGKKFLEYARAVLHLMDSATIAVRDSESAFSGQLAIGMAPSIGRACIPLLLPELVERYPRAAISVVEGLSGALYDAVLLGQLDFALLYNPAASPNIKITPIVAEPLYLIGAAPVGEDRDQVTLAAVAELPLILPHGNHSVRVAVESAAARLGLGVNVKLQVDSSYSTMQLVAQGIGYSIMPRLVGRGAGLPALSWQKIENPALEATLCMVQPAQQPSNPLVAAAAEVVRASLAQLLAA